MVVFTCNNCGDSVNKPKVEKHMQYDCKRKNFAVSFCCVDCLKDFDHETVKNHCQCVTEEQRYSAKGFVPKASSEKGKRKQANWVDIVQSLINRNDLPNDERQFLNIISKYDNVPRKINKFQNFCYSSAPAYRKKGYLVDKVFNMIEAEYKAQQTQNSNDKPANTNNIQNTESLEKDDIVQEEPQKIKEKKKKNVGNDKNGDIEIANNEIKQSSKKKKKLVTVNSEIEIKSEEKKKKKKEKKQQENNTVSEENLETTDTSTLQVQTDSVKKSKKKKSKLNLEESNGICENGVTKIENVSEKNDVTNKENVILHEKTESQMSKKEKKEMKKKKKYQDELANVTNGIIEADKKEPLSKKKKRKLNDNEENEEPQQKILKIEETSQVPPVQSGRKFEWNEAIKQVLQSKKSKPMSISKVLKRVMNEYHFLNETTIKSETKLEKIFYKKLRKMTNVTIDNDKVQLVEC